MNNAGGIHLLDSQSQMPDAFPPVVLVWTPATGNNLDLIHNLLGCRIRERLPLKANQPFDAARGECQ